MSRPQKEIDLDAALDLLMRGEKVPAIASELGISPPTLRSRIAEIQKEQGLLLQYRSIQSLQLTSLQAKILEAITPAKIDEAPLRDLVASYKILKDKELVIEGKPSEVKGLVAHLIYLEKQEQALREGTESPVEEAEFSEEFGEERPPANTQPSRLALTLSELDDSRF